MEVYLTIVLETRLEEVALTRKASREVSGRTFFGLSGADRTYLSLSIGLGCTRISVEKGISLEQHTVL